MNFIKKPYGWAIIFSIILILSVTFVLLDAFLIPRTIKVINDNGQSDNTTNFVNSETEADTKVTITDTSYKDKNIKINISSIRRYDTNVHIADIRISDKKYLKTAFAEGIYGRNIKETTSDMARENNAIIAINGDYYGFRGYGLVLRNGTLYRDEPDDCDALLIDKSGNLSILYDSVADEKTFKDAWQIFSFGPALLIDGKFEVTENSETRWAQRSNPRTAIGQISELHYVFIVSDGRTRDNAGLTLYELAEVFKEKGCTIAYNLDGGGSSTMWFNGKIVNNPTDGNVSSERSISDIVYIGY